jgi:hypothetical protein
MYVLAFVPTQLAQPFADSGNAARAEFWREETEQPKPGDLPRLLALGDERRGEEGERATDERAPVHYSIT